MVDDEVAVEARKNLKVLSTYKFPAQIWALTLKAMHVCLIPLVKESLCYFNGFAKFMHMSEEADKQKAMILFGEHLTIDTAWQHDLFVGWRGGILWRSQTALCICASTRRVL